jgi:hypothetical protein
MRRATVKKLIMMLTFLAAIAPAAALAQSGNGIRIRIDYYSDAMMTNAVGQSVELCDGTTYSNGYPTEYSTYEEYEC